MSNDLHIAIIGAGLGGLCFAQGLHRAGIRYTVFERDPSPDSRGQGYRIRIDAGGQSALRAVLPFRQVELFRESCATASAAGRFLDTQLNEVTGRPVDTWRPSATATTDGNTEIDLTANRQTLRQILMAGVEPRIRFGKTLRGFHCDDNGVDCHFEDGSSVRAGLLVAADGAASMIRRAILPHTEPRDTGDANIYGKTLMTSDHIAAISSVLADGISVVFAEDFAVIIDAIRFRAPLPQLSARIVPACSLAPVDDYFYWSFFGRRHSLGLPADRRLMDNPPDLRQHLQRLTATWHPGLQALFNLADPDVLAWRPVLSAPPLAIDHRSPVAFIGDAIHAMSPAGGLGANTALNDAARLTEQLVTAVSGRVGLTQALAVYHADMIQRADRAVRLSEEGSDQLTSRSLLCAPPTLDAE